ncbi:cyclophilin-like fold protein [Curtobacterium sp. L1-20]|uniref:cyclophilin-like fold protein n=1 Tax=Curtobacterium sp. L1-20 TaxID=3138181 RepID=UPI003B525DFC
MLTPVLAHLSAGSSRFVISLRIGTARSLDLARAPEESSAESAAIGYYSPQRRLVLYYDHVDSSSGIVPIGTYDDVDAVHHEAGSFSVRIRTA